MSSRLAWLLGTLCGAGLSPAAPGTVGSALTALAAYFAIDSAGLPGWSAGVAAALLFFPATWASGTIERESGLDDPGRIVIDEAVGQLLALAAARPGSATDCLLGLILFRVFDIWKPWPASRLEALPNGYGVVADDVAAGVYAMMILAILRYAGLPA